MRNAAIVGSHDAAHSVSRTTVRATILGIVILVAAGLRLHNLDLQSIWSDEAASIEQASGTIAELIAKTAADNYPPLHNLLLFVSLHVLGNSEFAARLPSALLGVADVGLVYLVGAVCGYRNAGLIAAAFVAVSTFHIQYSQEARMYALLTCTTTLLSYASLLYLKAPGWRRAVLVGIAGTAVLYAHPFGLINAVAIGSGAVVGGLVWGRWRRRLLSYCVTCLVPLLLFSPWAVVLLERTEHIGNTGFWIPAPTPSVLVEIGRQLLGGRLGGALFGVGIAALAVALVFRGRESGNEPRHATGGRLPRGVVVTMLASVGLLPFLAALVLSWVYQPLMLGRYLIGSAPALALLAAIGIESLSRRQWTTAGALLLVGVVGAVNLTAVRYVRDDWRGLGTRLTASIDPAQDCLVVYPWWAQRVLRYYFRGQPSCLVAQQVNDAGVPERVEGRRVFLVQYLAAGINDVVLPAFKTAGYKIASDEAFANARLVQLDPGAPAPPIEISLSIWGHHYLGAPRFEVRADDKVVFAGEVTATSRRLPDTFTFHLPAGMAPRTLVVALVNDHYDGEPSKDRNLLVRSMTINGKPADLGKVDLRDLPYLSRWRTGDIYISTNYQPLSLTRHDDGWW